MAERRRTIRADGAPAAIGPYSHAVAAGDLLFCSGQVGLDPETGELVGGGAAEETRRALANLDAVCRAAGTELAAALRCTIYLVDIAADWDDVNRAYGELFGDDPPARVTVGIAGLPKGARVEIDAIVALR